ncbi:MAG: phage holin family protein [Verrucomicrobiota bacterium JB023]|nr:phage holin family protein [Verrucomicrobiota bacterium JB023]
MRFPGDDSGLSLGRGFATYLRARLQLLGIESQEALVFLKGKLLPLVVVLGCALITYLLVLAALISFLGKLLAAFSKHPLLGWEIPALLIAALHLVALLKFKNTLSQQPDEPLFEYTRAEIENDRQWLHENTPAKKS